MKRHATCGLACSEEAGAALYGSSWSSDRRWQIHYCAIALAPFREQCDRQLVREELGLDEDCLVVGHVGSFAEAKNHAFLVRIAQELADRMPSMRLLLVGDGPLRPEIERQVQEAGLLGRVLFLGCRDDVARLLMGAMDVFVFPSVSEGLGLAFVEAQAAGLIALCADTVPREADVVDALCHRLSLAEAPAQWAEEITRLYREGASISRKQALSAVEASPFNIERSVAVLSALYSGEDAAALAAERG